MAHAGTDKTLATAGSRATVFAYSMSVSPPTPFFYCRICGSREYERVVVRKRDGKPYDTAFFACMGCTTMFGDPARYSAPPPKEKVTRIDAPISPRRSRGIARLEGDAGAAPTAAIPAPRSADG